LDQDEAVRWEGFLRNHPLGQYQQSVRWAWVKEGEGWRSRLVTWSDCNGSMAGGSLLLIKNTRFGRVGFVNKGPVLKEEHPNSIGLAMQRLLDTAASERVRALIVQPPDESRIAPADLRSHGFCRAPVPGIIDATLIASLEGGQEGVRSRLSRTARKQARQAQDRGVQTVEGTRADLPVFFELMCVTCRRQGVPPNPASVEALYRRWDAFTPDIRLFLATVKGEAVAGLLVLRFGDRCVFEKKGWNEKFPEAHPNTLLNVEAMMRAAAWGCRVVDFGAMDRSLAERMLAGKAVETELAATRYAFNLRLGARPVLLPEARVWIPWKWQRPWLDWLLSVPAFARRLERWVAA
jgi:lipid II:glycine glycyltransferase (peptidoglycan interpeptide bridge formation enzyme)